jgi:hypothetical protein
LLYSGPVFFPHAASYALSSPFSVVPSSSPSAQPAPPPKAVSGPPARTFAPPQLPY